MTRQSAQHNTIQHKTPNVPYEFDCSTIRSNGGSSPFSFPLPVLPTPSLYPLLPLSPPPRIQLGGLGSAVSSPSGVRVGVPAEKAILIVFTARPHCLQCGRAVIARAVCPSVRLPVRHIPVFLSRGMKIRSRGDRLLVGFRTHFKSVHFHLISLRKTSNISR